MVREVVVLPGCWCFHFPFSIFHFVDCFGVAGLASWFDVFVLALALFLLFVEHDAWVVSLLLGFSALAAASSF